MPDSSDNQHPTKPENPTQRPKKRKGGWLRVEIATRLSAIDKREREYTIDPDWEKLMHLSDEELERYFDDRPSFTVDEWLDRVSARRKAKHCPRPGQKVARHAAIPKWGRPLCGAKTRKGSPCQAPAVWDKANNRPRNGRCRMHGGLSTGPKTPEGRARSLSKLKNYRGG